MADAIKFSYGDAVQVRNDAPSPFLAIGAGSVAGISTISTPGAAQQFGMPLGTPIYVVENSAGDSCEIPEPYLCGQT